jgi:hypothetical protein
VQLGSDSAPGALIVPGAAAAQMGFPLTVPTDARIFTLGSYVRALSGYGPIDYRLCVWAWTGSLTGANKLLAQTAIHTINAGGDTLADLVRVTWDLVDPLEISALTDVLVGVAWDTDPAKAMLLGGSSGTGDRYRKDLADGDPWPTSMAGVVHVTDHDFVAWIDDYEPQSGIWVYRSGAWRQADAVLVRRDSLWTIADGVKVRRSGVWVTAD